MNFCLLNMLFLALAAIGNSLQTWSDHGKRVQNLSQLSEQRKEATSYAVSNGCECLQGNSILDIDSCKAAASYLGVVFKEESTWQLHTKGCDQRPDGLYFNNHPTGACSDYARAVCSITLQDEIQESRRGYIFREASLKTSDCGEAPLLDGASLETTISSTAGALMVAIANMKCAEAAKAAFSAKGVTLQEINFDGDFSYEEGQSDVWDWLHCTYHPDDQSGTTMHSYVFVDGEFVGQGFDAASKVESGELDDKLVVSGEPSAPCEDQYPDMADVVDQYMSNTSNRVLLFGWIECSCTGIAQGRLASASVCYDGRTWENPDSELMSYLQCKEKDTQSHSFLYFRVGDGWEFKGNGFAFDESDMTDETFNSYVTAADADTTCEQATVNKNLYGSELEECRADVSDFQGSWQDDGKCTELIGGVHQICIEQLPEDFSTETHQSEWSKERAGKRHCVCIGAFSLYMTDAALHQEGADDIMPHCAAIPETALTANYLQNWKDWNGFEARIKEGVAKLVSRCFSSAPSDEAKCGLKERFDSMVSDVAELQNAPELEPVQDDFASLQC